MDAVIRKYDHVAARYDRRWARYLTDTARYLAACLDGPPPHTILDAPCGSGWFTRCLAEKYPDAHLIGVDGSYGMLSQARIECAPHPRIRLIHAVVEALPLAAMSCEWVLCANTFHYFPHPLLVLEEFRRIITPSGRLVIVDWCRESIRSCAINRWLQWRDPTHVKTYTRFELQRLLEEAGFVTQRTECFRASWFLGWRIWDMMLVIAQPREV